ncbi:MAG: DNA replication/repair protein RecF [Bacilli bacterium]|nr:DNA replication/repair protein RecF [Bacilli bacterium]
MKFINIKLTNFRNYKKLNLSFNPTKNIIIGENGEGKTNIVEALYVLALSKSFRGSKEEVIIKNGEDSTCIEGTVKGDYKDKYKLVLAKEGKKVFINNTKIDKISDYLSKINIVLFTSEDLKLIKDTPSTRRRLINIELSQYSNEYLKLLSNYNKVLKQRNAYLKMLYFNGNASRSYLDILTDQLVDIGSKLYNYRQDFINNISNYIENNYYKITKKHDLVLSYKSDFANKSKEDLLKMYKKSLDKDITQGKTNLGIHHDDYIFELNGNNLRDYGSEGEQKNAIISLKMAEIDIFKNDLNIMPILILDDLFSELDKKKINNILDFISDDIQTFVTTTDLTKVDKRLKIGSKIFKIKNGNIREDNYE